MQFNVLMVGEAEIRRIPVKRRCPNHCTHDQILAAEREADESASF